MNDDRSLERAARAWLEVGPTRAPDRPVEAALAQIETTPQERAWPRPFGKVPAWRMDRVMTASAAVLVVALIGAVALLRADPGPGPAESPSPSPSSSIPPSDSPPPVASSVDVAPPVLTATFISPRNGFSVRYPGDWIVTAATTSWEAGAINLWGSAALDDLRGSTVRFAGTSQPLAAGQTPEEWLASYAAGSCLGPPSSWPTVPIGTATGQITANGCEAPGPPLGKGGRIFDAVVIVGGRAYNFTMEGELTPSDFVAVLAAVTLDPASAVDASPPP
jgi:hypothetical protein